MKRNSIGSLIQLVPQSEHNLVPTQRQRRHPLWNKFIFLKRDSKRITTEINNTIIKFSVSLYFPPGKIMDVLESIIDLRELKPTPRYDIHGECNPNKLKILFKNDSEWKEEENYGPHEIGVCGDHQDGRIEVKFRLSAENSDDSEENYPKPKYIFSIAIHLAEDKTDKKTVEMCRDYLKTRIRDAWVRHWPAQREKMEDLNLENFESPEYKYKVARNSKDVYKYYQNLSLSGSGVTLTR